MIRSEINLFSLLIICLLLFLSNSQCCLKFNGNDCISCPQKMHIYRGNCIYDIANCKQYSNGFDCSVCNVGFKLQNNRCTQIPKPQPKPQPKPVIQPQVKPPIQPQTKTQTKPSVQTQVKPQPKPQVKSQPKSQKKEYQQIIITLPLDPTSSDQKQQRASVVEQILRSTYSEIRSAEITKAFDRVYLNGTKIVELIFKANQKNKEVLYQALMMADIDTFIFKEISFGKYNPNSNTTNQKNNVQTSNPQDGKTGSSQPTNTSQSQTDPLKNSSNPIQNASSQVTNSSSPAPPQIQKPVTPALSKEQQEYSSLKFIHLSDLDALMDINFVLGLNQINEKVSQLEGQVPSQIKVQEGYNTSTLKVVHYVISFEVQSQGKPITYEIKLKVDTNTSKVTIDAVYKKHPSQSSQSNQTQPSTNQNTPQIKADEKTSSKSSYTQISADPSQAEVHFLIFLDNLGKNIEKKLSQSGQKPGENQIVFAGKYDSKDSINYWVETKVTFSNQSKILYKVVGSINKMTYEVKINEITNLGQQKVQTVTPVNTSTVSSNLKKEPQPTPAVQPLAPVQPVKPSSPSQVTQPAEQTNATVIKQYQEPKQVLSSSNQTNQAQTVPDPIKPVETVKTPEISALTPNSSASGVITISTNNSSNQTKPAEASQQKNSSFTVETPKPAEIPIQNKSQPIQPPKPAEPQTFPTPTPPAQKPQPKPSNPQISSQVFQEINETIYDKSAGFQEIKITDNMKDEDLSKVSDTLLLSRQGRQNKKVYKAFIKNFGIKAQYKIFFMDTTTNSPKIDLYQGYASFDLLRKRVFVIAFSPLNI